MPVRGRVASYRTRIMARGIGTTGQRGSSWATPRQRPTLTPEQDEAHFLVRVLAADGRVLLRLRKVVQLTAADWEEALTALTDEITASRDRLDYDLLSMTPTSLGFFFCDLASADEELLAHLDAVGYRPE